jgi:hypothetical protein
LEVLLKKLINKKIPWKDNILDYWKNVGRDKGNELFPLYKLATICLSVSATQVSVERCFSTLNYILSELRANLELTRRYIIDLFDP